MNIAFGALLIFILLFPGFVFRFAYLNGPHSRRNFQSSLTDEIVLSLVPALFIQLLFFLVIEHIFCFDINTELLYKLISGSTDLSKNPIDFDRVEKSMFNYTLYTLCTLIFAILTGKLFRYLVRCWHLDWRYHSLRFNNEWFYLFTGDILNFPEMPGRTEDIDFIQVDLLTTTQEGSFIYSGVLEQFYLSKEGLDRVCLSNVYRRKLSDDTKNETGDLTQMQFDTRYYNMPGDLFVIPYSEIKNINVSYFSIVENNAPNNSEQKK